MDRASKFQNPIPLNKSNVNKPSPIQSGGVGIKPPPPLIFDRFRALVKDREDELRVFGVGVGVPFVPLSTDEIVRIYDIMLSELTMNSKPIITDLTIIAGEQRAHGKGIADAICARIIEAPVNHKLPALYLLDSVVKNIGKEYVEYFSARLPEVFCEAYEQVHPNMHQAMHHLFGTWTSTFPFSVLHRIEVHLQFTPSVKGHSSILSSSRASESPRPTHGIHINPKYLEAQHQVGNSGCDGVKKPLASASRIMRSSSPYRIGLEEYTMDRSPKRAVIETSPSRSGIDYGLRQGNSNKHLKTCDVYNNGVDLRGPRALINAYGIDEREKKLNRKNHIAEQNGADQKVAARSWQNTEEEEFDWEDMAPVTADRTGNSKPRHSFTTNHGAPLATDYRGNWSTSHISSDANSSIIEDVSRINSGRGPINKTAGILPNVVALNDSTSQTHSPSFTRESLILPHQQYQSHLNAKGGSSFSENRSFPTLPQQTRGHFGMQNAANNIVDQGMNKTFLSELPLVNNRTTAHINVPQNPTQSPGQAHLNMQNTAQPFLLQPNLMMAQGVRQNLPLPSSVSTSSHTMLPPPNYGYLPQGHRPPTHSSLPFHNAPNMSFHGPGPAFQTPQRGPLPVGQNIGQVARNPPPGVGFSGLMSSLMAQGLISLTNKDSVGVEFDQDSLKVRHDSTITALYGDLPRQCTSCGLRFRSQEEHSKHMDWHVNKNRTLKNRKTKPSPKWFVSVGMWLSGAEALGTEAVPGFMPAEANVEKMAEEEMAVPADEEQNACALCGEPFDDFYSDEMEEWMYKGAVYMHAPVESTVGLDRSQLGPIVHAKCRSDSHGNPSEDIKTDEWESSEEGSSQRKRFLS